MNAIKNLRKNFAKLTEEERVKIIQNLNIADFSEDTLDILTLGISDQHWRVRKTSVDRMLEKKGNKWVFRLLIRGLQSQDNAGLRNSSTEALIKLGSESLPFLRNVLKNPNRDVRKLLLDVIGEIKDKSFLKIIAKHLKDEDANVRSAAAEAIGKIQDKRGVNILLGVLKKHDPYLGFTALESLSKLGEIYGISKIDKITMSISDPILGRAAYDALGKSKNPKAGSYLIKGLHDMRRGHRESVQVGLLSLYSSIQENEKGLLIEKLKEDFDDNIKDELLKSLNSYNQQIKLSSTAILSWMKVREAIPLMVEMLREDYDREHIIWCLVLYGSYGINEIISAMRNSDEIILSSLCRVLAKIGDIKVEPHLIELLTHESETVRISSALARGDIGSRNSIGDLFKLFADPNPSVWDAVRTALLSIGEKYKDETKSQAVEMILSEDGNLRGNAYFILGMMGGDNVLNLINLGIKDENPYVRENAAVALGIVASPDSVEQLAYTMTDEERSVRLAAVRALSNIRNPQVLDALKLGIYDEHIWVRVAAVKSIGERRSKDAFLILEEALNDAAPPVVVVALEAFKAKGDSMFAKSLEKVLVNNNKDVIKECVPMLKKLKTTAALKILKKAIKHPAPEVRELIANFAYTEYGKFSKTILLNAFKTENDAQVKSVLSSLNF